MTYFFSVLLIGLRIESGFSQQSCYSSAMEIRCKQISVNDKKSPILPPDDLACLQRGISFRIKKANIVEAREAYRLGVNVRGSGRKQRKYLYGSRYRNFFEGYYKVLDVREFGGSINLKIMIQDGEMSVLKIRDIGDDSELLQSVKNFNLGMEKSSVARSQSGDSGKMYAFGFHNSKDGNYKSMRNVKMGIKDYSITARKGLEKYFSKEIGEIVAADRGQGIVPTIAMGGEQGVSAYALVSEDLVNAAHYDLDTSVGISVFNELIPGKASNWNFVLPNTTLVDGNEKEAVVIKLFDGCAIAWDGRKIFHCTSTKDIGEGNHLYGNYWGGKKYY